VLAPRDPRHLGSRLAVVWREGIRESRDRKTECEGEGDNHGRRIFVVKVVQVVLSGMMNPFGRLTFAKTFANILNYISNTTYLLYTIRPDETYGTC
jgi:hypothetical protein